MNERPAAAASRSPCASAAARPAVVPAHEPPFAILHEEEAGHGVDGGVGEVLLLLQRLLHLLALRDVADDDDASPAAADRGDVQIHLGPEEMAVFVPRMPFEELLFARRRLAICACASAP